MRFLGFLVLLFGLLENQSKIISLIIYESNTFYHTFFHQDHGINIMVSLATVKLVI